MIRKRFVDILFVRHGETDWQILDERGVRGWARSFAPLTTIGRVQVDAIANDYRLQEADAILCSSYARALESAALINRKLNKSIYVEYDLHEWLPNKDSLADVDDKTLKQACEEFVYYTGVTPFEDNFIPNGKSPTENGLPTSNNIPLPENRTWESLEEVRERALRALKRYDHLAKIVVVAHAVLIASIVGEQRYIKHAEIVPFKLDFDRLPESKLLTKSLNGVAKR